MNQQVKDLIQKLGEAIHESVSDSDQISGVVKEIREQGFDVLLMLEATIGLNEIDEQADDVEAEEGEESADGAFTRNDLTFLRSLRITTEETSAEGDITSSDAGADFNASSDSTSDASGTGSAKSDFPTEPPVA